MEPVSVVLTSLLICTRDQIPAVVLSSPWQSNEEGPVPRRDSLLCCGLMDGGLLSERINDANYAGVKDPPQGVHI